MAALVVDHHSLKQMPIFHQEARAHQRTARLSRGALKQSHYDRTISRTGMNDIGAASRAWDQNGSAPARHMMT